MKLGIIDEGKLKGKKVILEPRQGLKDNEFLVEDGVFMNGSALFSRYCLNKGCEVKIEDHCINCN